MTQPHPLLILASQSPRREQLLKMLGLQFEITPADVDETYRKGESAKDHAERLAREKAMKVSARRPGALVIGSDTVVVLDRRVLGKPRDAAEAVDMLMRLQGRTHRVETGIAVATPDQLLLSGVETVRVHFRTFDRVMAEEYVATQEPMDKAGAYGIQGFGAAIVERIEGDFFAVMGLPIARMLALLRAAGWRYNFQRLERAE
jgi:nucleoside triphosphate pyrophosphatase